MLEDKLDGFTGKIVRGAVAVYSSLVLYGCGPGFLDIPAENHTDDEALALCCRNLKCGSNLMDTECEQTGTYTLKGDKYARCRCYSKPSESSGSSSWDKPQRQPIGADSSDKGSPGGVGGHRECPRR